MPQLKFNASRPVCINTGKTSLRPYHPAIYATNRTFHFGRVVSINFDWLGFRLSAAALFATGSDCE